VLAKNSSFIFFGVGIAHLAKNKCAVCAAGFQIPNFKCKQIFFLACR